MRYGSSYGNRKNPPRNHFRLEPAPKVTATPVGHDRLVSGKAHRDSHLNRIHGAVELLVQVITPVHVGTGSFELHEGQIRKAPMTRNGRLIVPGTSIKGICRLTHEALAGSASPFDKRTKADDPSASLFGALGYQGRISFDDAISEEPLTPQVTRFSNTYSPQKKPGRRFYGPQHPEASQRALVPGLAIPAQSELRTYLRFHNITEQELGTVLLALGVGHFNTRLGGAKYDHYGWVRFSGNRHRLRLGIGRPGQWVDNAIQNQAFFARALDSAKELLTGSARNLQTLREKMVPDREGQRR